MDTLESFVAVNATQVEAWPFVTDVDKITMWTAPLAELVVRDGVRVIDAGSTFDLVLDLPQRPVLHCTVLSLEEEAVTAKLDGFVLGRATWRIVSAGKGILVHARFKCELADRRWLVPWVLVGRWCAAVGLNWLLRRFKARIEDTVGSSTFGIPLLVSRYAAASASVAAGILFGLGVLRIGQWLGGRGRQDLE